MYIKRSHENVPVCVCAEVGYVEFILLFGILLYYRYHSFNAQANLKASPYSINRLLTEQSLLHSPIRHI